MHSDAAIFCCVLWARWWLSACLACELLFWWVVLLLQVGREGAAEEEPRRFSERRAEQWGRPRDQHAGTSTLHFTLRAFSRRLSQATYNKHICQKKDLQYITVVTVCTTKRQVKPFPNIQYTINVYIMCQHVQHTISVKEGCGRGGHQHVIPLQGYWHVIESALIWRHYFLLKTFDRCSSAKLISLVSPDAWWRLLLLINLLMPSSNAHLSICHVITPTDVVSDSRCMSLLDHWSSVSVYPVFLPMLHNRHWHFFPLPPPPQAMHNESMALKAELQKLQAQISEQVSGPPPWLFV